MRVIAGLFGCDDPVIEGFLDPGVIDRQTVQVLRLAAGRCANRPRRLYTASRRSPRRRRSSSPCPRGRGRRRQHAGWHGRPPPPPSAAPAAVRARSIPPRAGPASRRPAGRRLRPPGDRRCRRRRPPAATGLCRPPTRSWRPRRHPRCSSPFPPDGSGRRRRGEVGQCGSCAGLLRREAGLGGGGHADGARRGCVRQSEAEGQPPDVHPVAVLQPTAGFGQRARN